MPDTAVTEVALDRVFVAVAVGEDVMLEPTSRLPINVLVGLTVAVGRIVSKLDFVLEDGLLSEGVGFGVEASGEVTVNGGYGKMENIGSVSVSEGLDIVSP